MHSPILQYSFKCFFDNASLSCVCSVRGASLAARRLPEQGAVLHQVSGEKLLRQPRRNCLCLSVCLRASLCVSRHCVRLCIGSGASGKCCQKRRCCAESGGVALKSVVLKSVCSTLGCHTLTTSSLFTSTFPVPLSCSV